MALKVFDAEECTAAGLADSTQLNASNSSWDNGGPFFYYRTTGGYTLPGVYQAFPSVAAGDAFASTKAAGLATNGPFRFRMFFMVNSWPTSAVPSQPILRYIGWQQPYTRVWIRMNSAGKIEMYTNSANAEGTYTLLYTSTMVVPINTWCRLEVVINPGTTTANSIVGLAGVVAPTANRRFTTGGANTSIEAYFYSTNANLGISQGISQTNVGKNNPSTLYSWQPSFAFDDVQIDNGTFGSDPNSWIGNIYSTATDLFSAAAVARLTIPTTTQVNVKSGAVAMRATPSMDIAGLGQGQRALTAAAVAGLSVAGAVSRSQAVDPFVAVARLTLGPVLTHLGPTVAAGAVGSLAVVPGATQAVVMQGAAALVLLGQRMPTAVFSTHVTAALNLLGALVFANYSDDEVIARILSQSAEARLFAGMVAASLLAGDGTAQLFDEAAEGIVLPNGSMAIIQD